jgi:large subunit ribosomal protein L15
MRANDLSPVPGSVHKKKRIGRGNASGHGTYSTRGIKGQQSRSGPDLRIGFEGGQIPLVRALSRKRGFSNARFRVDYEAINVGDLAKLPAGSEVTSESLRAAGIVKSARRPVKVLGDGELKVKLNVTVEKLSAAAKAKIEAAGGTATALVAGKAAAQAEAEPAAEAPQAVAEAPAEEPKAEASAPPPAEASAEPAAEAKPARRARAPRAKAAEGTDSETTET